MQPSLSTSDLVLTNLTTGMTVDPADLTLQYDAATNVATFTATGLDGGLLSDGNYRATLPAGSVNDGLGHTLEADFIFDFFVLAGDANRDRQVNLLDFNILAANFGQSGAPSARATSTMTAWSICWISTFSPADSANPCRRPTPPFTCHQAHNRR